VQRNWDTIRRILIATEELPQGKALTRTSFPEEQAYEIAYHVEILSEAGIIHSALSHELGGGIPHFHIWRLTWEGHELLDSIKSDTIWQKTKSFIADKGGSMTFDVVKGVAVQLSKIAIGTVA
jgi:hypothetical protein